MSAPERVDEEALLDALRNAPGAPPHERAAMWRSIATNLDLPGPDGPGGDEGGGAPPDGPGPTTPTGGLGTGSLGTGTGSLISAKLAMLGAAATFVIGAATGGAVTFLAVPPRDRAPRGFVEAELADEPGAIELQTSLTDEPASAEEEAPSVEPMLMPSEPPRAVRIARPARDAPTLVSPEPAETTLDREAERALLRQAHAAMARGEAALALETLATHRRRYPESVQDEERAALEVAALRSAGEAGRAASARAQFLERYPSSIFRELVDPPTVRPLE